PRPDARRRFRGERRRPASGRRTTELQKSRTSWESPFGGTPTGAATSVPPMGGCRPAASGAKKEVGELDQHAGLDVGRERRRRHDRGGGDKRRLTPQPAHAPSAGGAASRSPAG